MDFLTDKKYSFELIDKSVNPTFSPDTFAVVNFKGFEGISRPYEFDILLVSDNAQLDLSKALSLQAKLTFHRENDQEVYYHGVLAQFEQLQEYQGIVFYRALLVPRLWWLTLTHQNKVHLNCSVLDIIEFTLKDSGLTSKDYTIDINNTKSVTIDNKPVDVPVYPKIDYICQYGESHLNFISRWAEREGIYYYFKQTTTGEIVVFTDTKISHTTLPSLPETNDSLYFSTPSGLSTLHSTEIIKSFTCRQRQLPKKVLLKDYNYERPSLEISGTAQVDPNGRGEVYLYGEHFSSTEEGNNLAKIRAEELLSRKEQYFAESTVPFLLPGYTFTLKDHYRSDFNEKKYLICDITHEGSQTGYLISGIQNALTDMEKKVDYLNQFTVIPAKVQFRPERKAQKSRISGTIHAKIDGELSNDFAELDAQGRYKVRLPFDTEYDTSAEHDDDTKKHKPGKASKLIRMMQPHAGEPVAGGQNHGLHFPLRKGTEVLLTFIDGDPDRPVIAGAVSNPESKSPVTGGDNTVTPAIEANNKQSIFRDRSGNELIFDSTEGNEHISIQCPYGGGSGVVYGKGEEGEGRFEWSCANKCELSTGNTFEGFMGNAGEVKIGTSTGAFFGLSNEIGLAGKHEALFGYKTEFQLGPKFEYHEGHAVQKSGKDCDSKADENNIISAGEKLNLSGGIFKKTKVGKIIKKEKTANTSIINLDKDALTLSFGKNVNPDKTADQKVIKVFLVALPLLVCALSAVLAAISFIFLEVKEATKKHDGMNAGFSSAHGVTTIIETLLIIAEVILMMILGHFGLEDKIVPVSHTDEDDDEPDALIRLEDAGLYVGIKPKIKDEGLPGAPKIVMKKDESVSKLEMDKNGNVFIHSKEKEITIGRGKSGSEKAKFHISSTDQAEVYAGRSWLKLYENGDSYLSGNKKLSINSRNGDLMIQTIDGIGGSINIESNKAMNIKCKIGDINIAPTAGKTKIKGFVDLG
ncbi:MAG: type VI secretion system tip protein VgrG [Candidatus Latescibacteria bacterium]|nr:type VI secretion system tip protein VgrG [Candidatus Latescibacterota bacterium]